MNFGAVTLISTKYKVAISAIFMHMANRKVLFMIQKIKKYRFLFEELVKRDFTKKYKGTIFGMLWSVMGPLMHLLVMALVFSQLFARKEEYYVIYLFCGNLLYSFFRESTSLGMRSLYENAPIFTKINVPKYMFLLSKNVSTIINFGINLCVLFVFILIYQVPIHVNFILIIYPIVCMVIFNLGVGLILSALYMKFRDIAYFYDIFTMLLMYLSAIFYYVDEYPEQYRWLFLMNPVYVYIKYFRSIIIYNTVPSLIEHLLGLGYAVVMLFIGAVIYKKNNYKFLYYV